MSVTLSRWQCNAVLDFDRDSVLMKKASIAVRTRVMVLTFFFFEKKDLILVIRNNSEEKIIYFALQHFETRKFRLFASVVKRF